MSHRYLPLLVLPTLATLLACGGNPPPSTPEAVVVESQATSTSSGELTDERVMELGRGYAAMVHAADYDGLWQSLTAEARQEFGTFERFREEGDAIVSELGGEIGVLREAVQPARAGMRATKLYFRVSHYAGADGRPVRLLIGIMADGSIAGMDVAAAQQ